MSTKWIAALLLYGTWLSSLVIAAGLVFAYTHSGDMRIATVGIALLILLPVARLFLMLFAFLRERDYRLAVAAALVLLIILTGVMVGVRSAAGSAG